MPLYQVNAGDRILAADINQFYQILKGVAASGEAVTLVYNNQSLIFQPSSDPAAGTRVVLIKNTSGTVLATWRYDGLMELLSAAAAPASPVAGSLYFDTLLNTLRSYDGTTWQGAGDPVNGWPWYWTPGMSIETTLTGTGSYTVPAGFVHGQLSCGATSGSNVGLRMTMSGPYAAGNNGTSEIRYWAFTLATDKAASEAWRVFLTDESVTGQPSLTAKHLGVRFDGTTVSFSTADGTTEQTTDVTAQFTASTTAHCVVLFDGTTARLWVDSTLRATHATNIPTSAAGVISVFRAHIVNSAAADKVIYLAAMQVRGLA